MSLLLIACFLNGLEIRDYLG